MAVYQPQPYHTKEIAVAAEFELEETIDAPRQDVFDAHVDVDSFHEWMPGCEKIEKLTDGPVGEGTKWRETRTIGRHTATEEFEISALERPSSLSLYCDGSKGSNGRGEYFFDYTFEEVDGGTRVRLHGKMDMGGFIANLFMRLFNGTFVGYVRKDMEAIGEYVAGKE